jgi:hypothetical protein
MEKKFINTNKCVKVKVEKVSELRGITVHSNFLIYKMLFFYYWKNAVFLVIKKPESGFNDTL